MAAVTYKEAVYKSQIWDFDREYIWCEFESRFHTAFELRYRVRVYLAIQNITEHSWKKGEHVADSHWKKSERKAREDLIEEVGELLSENLVYEKWIGASDESLETEDFIQL